MGCVPLVALSFYKWVPRPTSGRSRVGARTNSILCQPCSVRVASASCPVGLILVCLGTVHPGMHRHGSFVPPSFFQVACPGPCVWANNTVTCCPPRFPVMILFLWGRYAQWALALLYSRRRGGHIPSPLVPSLRRGGVESPSHPHPSF